MASEELAVLAAACNKNEVYQIISEDAELFGPYGDVFNEIRSHYNKYRQAPSFEILRHKIPDLEDVATEAPTAYYLEQLKASYLRSRIENLILRATKGLKIDTPPKVLDKLQTEFAKLHRLTATTTDLNLMDTDLAREHYLQVAERVEESGGSLGIPTGFLGMDTAYTTGFAPGHLCYAMGYSQNGKSFFAPLMAIRAWEHGVKPMILSMEMTPESMRDRIYTMMANGALKNDALQRGQIDFDTFDTWAASVKRAGRPDFICTSGTEGQDITPNYIDAKIEQHQPGFLVCHEMGTRIYADGEWMNVEEHPSALTRVGDGFEVSVYGQPNPEVVTPEHRYFAKLVPTYREQRSSGSRHDSSGGWVEARDLTDRHFIGWEIDYSVEPPPSDIGMGTSHGEGFTHLLDDPDFWWMVGLWWGDGNLNNNGRVEFSMANKYPALKERLSDIITNKLGRTLAIKELQGCEKYAFTHTALFRFLAEWKQGDSRKTPPSWVERIDPSLQAALLGGYRDADGFVGEAGYSIASIHLDGLQSARRMLARCGVASGISWGNRKEYVRVFPNGKTGKCQMSYSLLVPNAPGQNRGMSRNYFIRDGYLWTKFRSKIEVKDRTFVPIQTDSHEYHTVFGKSHNCDYQQLLMDNEKSQNMTARMTALSRELKILAVKRQIPILVISSVTDSDNGRDVPPTIDQLAWARAMEYNADMIFAVHRKKDTDIMQIIGRKNRFGPLWAMSLDVDFNTGRFEENEELAGVE